MRFVLLICSLFGISFGSCKSQEKLQMTTEEPKGPTLVFGFGGGFAGTQTVYRLHSDGQMFRRIGRQKNMGSIKSLDPNLCKQLFETYDAMAMSEVACQDPGNKYKFLTYKSGEGEHDIRWGGQNVEIPEKIINYYNTLIALGKRNSPETKK